MNARRIFGANRKTAEERARKQKLWEKLQIGSSPGCQRSMLGFVFTPIAINVLGSVLFARHRAAQGLGTIFFFFSIVAAPAGALYWAAGPRMLARVAATSTNATKIALCFLVYLVIIVASLCVIAAWY
jgi:hypothetical protein